MKDVQTLTSLAQVRAAAHPTRLRLLDLLGEQVMTTSQAAEVLKVPATRLYHHVEVLERAGLVRVVRTARKRGTIEKYYEATGRELMVDRGALEASGRRASARGYSSLFLSGLRATLEEAVRNGDLIRPVKDGRNALLFRERLARKSPDLAPLLRQVESWIRKCFEAGSDDDPFEYALTVAFYPVRKTSKRKRKR